ncbi:MAG: hypothetical protein RMH75_07200 [Archaeoglobaceae archaeon]|nr:hypothetical protein [Archaeoglobaceae archaeon]
MERGEVLESVNISIMVNSRDKLFDVAKKLVHNSELSEEIKNDLINWINSANAKKELIFYVLDEKGEKRLLNLNDRVMEVIERHGNMLYMELLPIVD